MDKIPEECLKAFQVYMGGSIQESFSEDGKSNCFSQEEMIQAEEHIKGCKLCLSVIKEFSKKLEENYPYDTEGRD